MTIQTHFIEEPLLEFGNGQKLEHPQDGLFLYGPVVAQGSPGVIHVGIVGTQDGIDLVTKWLAVLMRRLPVERRSNCTAPHGPDFKPPSAFGSKRGRSSRFRFRATIFRTPFGRPTAMTPCGRPSSSLKTRSLSIFAPTTGGPMSGSRSSPRSCIDMDARKSPVPRTQCHPRSCRKDQPPKFCAPAAPCFPTWPTRLKSISLP